MIEGIKMFLKHIMTELDGESFDINRVMFAAVVLTFIGATLWAVIANKQPVAWLEVGGGGAAVLAGGGGALAANRKNQVGVTVTQATSPSGPPPEVKTEVING